MRDDPAHRGGPHGPSRSPTVPCHNDLLAENYLDDGAWLWLVDWEYSGNNDPAFELGNTCQELGFDDDQVAELCAAYFGAASPALLARMRLQMIMSDVGWTLWAAIQARISTIDYDFAGWAEERWARAASAPSTALSSRGGSSSSGPSALAAHPLARRVDQDVGRDDGRVTRSSKTSTSRAVPDRELGREVGVADRRAPTVGP